MLKQVSSPGASAFTTQGGHAEGGQGVRLPRPRPINGRPFYREVSTYETPKEEWPSVKYNRPGVVDF